MAQSKKEDQRSWIMGGCVMIGMGVGFIFFTKSVFIFLACLFCGIGLGLVLSALLAGSKTD